MRPYLELCTKALSGEWKENRTGVRTIGYFGDIARYDLRNGFPAMTTKKLAFKSCVGEMLGFMRGYNTAEQFERLGCKVWRANADENQEWLKNPHRLCSGDLGRIYGVQARTWNGDYDQLDKVYRDLLAGRDNRREIVTHWNPTELEEMALPPCHMFYQFNITGDVLNLAMYQRSCDLPLGVPFNIAGYAWLLQVMAHITGHKPGVFTHMMGDLHIYENQIPMMREQLKRTPHRLPNLLINPKIKTLDDLETWVKPDDFELDFYRHHPAIKYPFAV